MKRTFFLIIAWVVLLSTSYGASTDIKIINDSSNFGQIFRLGNQNVNYEFSGYNDFIFKLDLIPELDANATLQTLVIFLEEANSTTSELVFDGFNGKFGQNCIITIHDNASISIKYPDVATTNTTTTTTTTTTTKTGGGSGGLGGGSGGGGLGGGGLGGGGYSQANRPKTEKDSDDKDGGYNKVTEPPKILRKVAPPGTTGIRVKMVTPDLAKLPILEPPKVIQVKTNKPALDPIPTISNVMPVATKSSNNYYTGVGILIIIVVIGYLVAKSRDNGPKLKGKR